MTSGGHPSDLQSGPADPRNPAHSHWAAEDTGSGTWTCSCIAVVGAAVGIDDVVVVASSSAALAVSAVVTAAPFASAVAVTAVVLSVFVVAAVAASAFAALVVSVVVDTRHAAVTAVAADTVVAAVVADYCMAEAHSRCIRCPARSPD